MTKINVSIRRICLILLVLAIYFFFQSTILQYLNDLYAGTKVFMLDRLTYLFDSGGERSVPTYFSVVLLTTSGCILGFIAYLKYLKKHEFRFYWALLTVIFIFLAIDESTEIHESFTDPLKSIFDFGGIFYFSWVIVGAIFVSIVGLIYLRFLLHLPRKTAVMMVVSAVIFVSGAIVLEAISGSIYEANEGKTLLYRAIGNFEEFLEMSGIILFIYTLLSYLEGFVPQFEVNLQISSENNPVDDTAKDSV